MQGSRRLDDSGFRHADWENSSSQWMNSKHFWHWLLWLGLDIKKPPPPCSGVLNNMLCILITSSMFTRWKWVYGYQLLRSCYQHEDSSSEYNGFANLIPSPNGVIKVKVSFIILREYTALRSHSFYDIMAQLVEIRNFNWTLLRLGVVILQKYRQVLIALASVKEFICFLVWYPVQLLPSLWLC